MKLHKDAQLNGREHQSYFLLLLVFIIITIISTEFGEAVMQKPFPPAKKKKKTYWLW